MGALNGYDNIKSQAMNTHNEIEGNINSFKNSVAANRCNFKMRRIKYAKTETEKDMQRWQR